MQRGETHSNVETQVEYITCAELGRRLVISRSTIYRQGFHDFAVKVGRVWRFDWEAIVQVLREETETERGE